MQEKQKAMDRAVRALASRAHSEAEIVKKLEASGYEESIIAQVMAKLVEYGLVDDAAFARDWARARARRGMGRYRIAQELRMKGIEGDMAEMALSAIDEDASFASAVALCEKHLRRGDERAKKRAYDALIRRGYAYDVAKEALAQAEAENMDD